MSRRSCGRKWRTNFHGVADLRAAVGAFVELGEDVVSWSIRHPWVASS